METFKSFEELLYDVNDDNFEDIALRLFHFQYSNNPVYKAFVTQLKRGRVQSVQSIPFLPITFFRDHSIQSGKWLPEAVFTSSGTTGVVSSRHHVKSLQFYGQHAERVFTASYGPLTDYHFLALLPSYLERADSSLVAMADYFIKKTNSEYSGFYLNYQDDLADTLQSLKKSDRKVLLLGVTFALLDFAESRPLDLSHCVVMETGGMKGRRKEIVREEAHRYLCERFHVPRIHSEYGMTELLSQAYSEGDGHFKPPAAMKIYIRSLTDPFGMEMADRTGGINVIDLANIHSCAFIQTQDLGKKHQDGSFEVLGRIDNSDLRGCNLLAE